MEDEDEADALLRSAGLLYILSHLPRTRTQYRTLGRTIFADRHVVTGHPVHAVARSPGPDPSTSQPFSFRGPFNVASLAPTSVRPVHLRTPTRTRWARPQPSGSGSPSVHRATTVAVNGEACPCPVLLNGRLRLDGSPILQSFARRCALLRHR